MRIGARQVVNLVLAAVVGLVATLWAVIGLARVRPFDHPKTVRASFSSSGGALPGAEVTYLGVSVGRVAGVHLRADSVELRLTIRPKGPMARDLRADVRQKSALGEPYVDLSPASPHATIGDPDGAVVPLSRTTVPKPLNTLLTSADRLLSDLQPGDLGRAIDGASGIVGHESDLRQLISGAATIAEVVGRRHAQMGVLIADAAKLTATLDAHRADLASATQGWARVSEVLGRHTEELATILDKGGDVGTDGAAILARARPDFEGFLAGLDVTFHNLAIRPTKVRETIDLAPLMITNFGRTFEGGNFWLSAGGASPFFPGYQPRYGVPIYGTGLRLDRIFLPTIAQRIDVDLGGAGMLIRLLPPDDARAAIDGGPSVIQRLQERERVKLERGGPRATP